MKIKKNNFGEKFNSFKVGQLIIHSPGKTITEGESHMFSLLTMNHHPIHIDKNYAKKTRFKKNIVVGTYIIALIVGMSVRDVTAKSLAALEYEKILHLKPAFIGDTIYAKSKIIEKRVKKNNFGILVFETIGFNQKNEKIVYLKRKNLFINE